MSTLRRGKKTDEVFAHATRATSHFYSNDPETGRPIHRVEEISIADARRLFADNKRSQMKDLSDGTYVFVIGTPIGYERVELST
jgi:hypothetical protein